jgi:hypothetical protein
MLLLIAGLLVTLVITALISFLGISGRSLPYTEEDWGSVQSIRYVGSFGPTTQVDTDSRTFLLGSTANLAKGTRVVRRQDYFGKEVCIAGSKTCWDLLGK